MGGGGIFELKRVKREDTERRGETLYLVGENTNIGEREKKYPEKGKKGGKKRR